MNVNTEAFVAIIPFEDGNEQQVTRNAAWRRICKGKSKISCAELKEGLIEMIGDASHDVEDFSVVEIAWNIYGSLPFEHNGDVLTRAWFRFFLLSFYRCIDFFNLLSEYEHGDQIRLSGVDKKIIGSLIDEIQESDLNWGFLVDSDEVEQTFDVEATNGKVSLEDVCQLITLSSLQHETFLPEADEPDSPKPPGKTQRQPSMLKLTNFKKYSKDRSTLFSRLDVNGDRVLSVTEFHQGLSNIGIDFSDEEVNYIFSVLDPQGLGTLTYRKFLYYVPEGTNEKGLYELLKDILKGYRRRRTKTSRKDKLRRTTTSHLKEREARVKNLRDSRTDLDESSEQISRGRTRKGSIGENDMGEGTKRKKRAKDVNENEIDAVGTKKKKRTKDMGENESEAAVEKLSRPRSRKRAVREDTIAEDDSDEISHEENAAPLRKRDVEVVYGDLCYTASDFNRKAHCGQLLVSLLAPGSHDNIRGRHKFRGTSFRKPPIIVMCPEVKRGGKHVYVDSIYNVKKTGFSFNIRKWEGRIDHFKKERVNFLAVQKGRGHITIGKRSYAYEALTQRIKEKPTSPHLTITLRYKQQFKKLDNMVVLSSVQVPNGVTTSFSINVREIRAHAIVVTLLAHGDHIPDKCTLNVVLVGGKKVCNAKGNLEESISETADDGSCVGKFTEFVPRVKGRPLLFAMCKSPSLVIASPVISLFKLKTRWNVISVGTDPKMEGEVHCVGF